MTNEVLNHKRMKETYLVKISELLDKPIRDAKIQIDIHYDEVPTLRYDITEYIFPKDGDEDES